MLRDFSPQAIKKFQAIWKAQTGQDIDLETAQDFATSMVGLVESVVEGRKQHKRIRDPPQT